MRAKDHELYAVWKGMKQRCNNNTSKCYADYGGRGIKVCDRWANGVNGFWNFVEDMGTRPSGYSIDRIDNNKGYFPENCRWSSRKDQQRNQRVTRKVVIEGVTYVAANLSEEYGIKTDTIVQRASLGLTFAQVVDKQKRVYTAGLALGGKANGESQKAKTHCPKGHQYNEQNTSYTPKGWRRCKECHRIKEQSRRGLI